MNSYEHLGCCVLHTRNLDKLQHRSPSSKQACSAGLSKVNTEAVLQYSTALLLWFQSLTDTSIQA